MTEGTQKNKQTLQAHVEKLPGSIYGRSGPLILGIMENKIAALYKQRPRLRQSILNSSF